MTDAVELGLIMAAFIIAGVAILAANWPPRDPCRKWCGRLECEDYCRRRDRR